MRAIADKRIKGITIELNGDTTPLEKALKDVTKESMKIQGELKEVEKSLKFNPSNTELIAQKQELLANQIQNTTQKLESLKQAQSQVDAQFANGKINEEQYRAFNRELVNTETALSGLQQKLASVAQEQQVLDSKTKQLQTLFNATGTDVDHFADTLGVGLVNAIKSGNASIKQLDVAIDKIGKASLGGSIDVDKLKTALKSADDGNSLENIRKDLSQVSEEARQAGDEVNSFGDKLTSVASGLATGAGIGSIIEKAMDVSSLQTKIDLSFDVSEESKQSVRDAIKSIEVYGVEGEEALEGVRRQWALNKNASDETNASLVKQAATVANAYAGIDFIELIQETNEFASALGISNEEALALTNALLKAGFPPEQLDTLAEYGMQMKGAGFDAREIQSIFRAGIDTKSWNIDNLNDGVKEVRIQMASFGQEIPAAVAPLLTQAGLGADKFQAWGKAVAAGGTEGSKAMSEMVNWLDSIEDKALKNEIATKVFGTKWEDQGQNMIAVFSGLGNAMDMTSQNADLLNTQMQTLDNDPAVQMQQAMTNLNTAMTPLMTTIASIVGWVAQWAADNPTLASTITVIVTVLGLLGGAFIALFPTIMAMTTSTITLTSVLSALMSPVILVVAAIAALALGLTYLYNNNETVKNGLTTAWEFIKSTAQTVFDAILSFWQTWGETIISFFTSMWETIKGVFTTVFDVIASLVRTVFEEIKLFWDTWGTTITQAFKSIFEILKTVFKTVFDSIFSTIKTVFSAIQSFWETWGGVITNYFKTTFNVIKSVFEGVWNQIKIIVETAIGIISNVIKLFLSVLKGDWQGAWDAIKGIVDSVWNGIKNTFSNVGQTMMNIGKDIIRGLINGIKSMASAVVDTAKGIANSIGDSVKDFFGIHSPSRLMLEYGKFIMQGLGNGIVKTAKQAINAASQAASSISSALQVNAGIDIATNGGIASNESSGNSINMAGLFSGANIIVRSDQDINKIAKAINNVTNTAGRGTGGVTQ